jgi:hypothetical protein
MINDDDLCSGIPEADLLPHLDPAGHHLHSMECSGNSFLPNTRLVTDPWYQNITQLKSFEQSFHFYRGCLQYCS